ncbi:MAG: hypothetical protein QM640_02870 [Niabella sp.]
MPADTLRWQEGMQLTWSDFEGDAIDVPGLMGEIFCLLPSRYKKDSPVSTLRYEVLTVLDKKASWIHPQKKNSTSLKFFQLHFDLFECYARRMRKYYSEITSDTDPAEIFNKIYDTQMSALALELKQMKSDTKMGNNAVQIDAWRKKIDQNLKDLAQYQNTL